MQRRESVSEPRWIKICHKKGVLLPKDCWISMSCKLSDVIINSIHMIEKSPHVSMFGFNCLSPRVIADLLDVVLSQALEHANDSARLVRCLASLKLSAKRTLNGTGTDDRYAGPSGLSRQGRAARVTCALVMFPSGGHSLEIALYSGASPEVGSSKPELQAQHLRRG